MDAVVGALQSSKTIYAASKLSYFDKMKNEGQLHMHQGCTSAAIVIKSASTFSFQLLSVFKGLFLTS